MARRMGSQSTTTRPSLPVVLSVTRRTRRVRGCQGSGYQVHPGSAKQGHLALALGIEELERGYRVRFRGPPLRVPPGSRRHGARRCARRGSPSSGGRPRRRSRTGTRGSSSSGPGGRGSSAASSSPGARAGAWRRRRRPRRTGGGAAGEDGRSPGASYSWHPLWPSSEGSRAGPPGATTRHALLDEAIEVLGTDPEAPGAQTDDGQRPRLPEPPDVADGDVEPVGDLVEGKEGSAGAGSGIGDLSGDER